MRSQKRILVTSALPYANGAIHFGHLAGAYLPADIYVRYHRLKHSDVLYICGSDEHGVSILLSAKKEGVLPNEIIDRYHALNKEAFTSIGISFDHYSRTSQPIHHETAQEWFLDFHQKGILRNRTEKQLFDNSVGMFLPDRFVIGTCPHCGYDRAYGDQCENCSKYYNQTELINPKSLVSANIPTIKDAVHWYFPLGEFQKRLETYVESHVTDWKDTVLQQVRSWLKTGLSDRPISRDLEWGVKVPLADARGKVLYVWFEAVLGYISATKEWAAKQGTPDRWKDYWCKEDTRYIAFIGKDNIVFHCLMFPAMLMAKEGYILPDNVPANEFLNLEGQKFSKSRAWSIEIKDFLEVFPPDPLRYTLTMNMPESRDSDFYWKDFQMRTNNELADILGNFVNRTLHFIRKNFNGKIPVIDKLTFADEEFISEFKSTGDEIGDCFERFRFRDGLVSAMNLARRSNKYFNDEEPWKTVKSDPVRCGTSLALSLRAIYALGIFLEPVLPFTSEKIRALLHLTPRMPWDWNSAFTFVLPAGHKVGEAKILFHKIEDEIIEKEIAKLGALSTKHAVSRNYVILKETISIDDFEKMDLRVGHILSAERIPKSEKLLKLKVDIGFDERQVVAGIGKAYSPNELVGATVVLVANLQPVKLFGVESQGMILAATNKDGFPFLVRPPTEIHPGTVVK